MAIENTIVLASSEVFKVLYYETGFEQLHPKPEVWDWMNDQGYTYKIDWRVGVAPAIDHGELPYYWFEFPNNEIMSLFALRWMGKEIP